MLSKYLFKILFCLLFIWLLLVLAAACGTFFASRDLSLRFTDSPIAACRLSSHGMHAFSRPVVCAPSPRPGIKPTSPVLQGGFLTTRPAGKS